MYTRCPNCGTTYSQSDYSTDKIHCAKCDYDFYLSPKPACGIIIENDQGEIVLVRRKSDPSKGKWDVPGGFVGYWESLEESAVREAMEELGVHIGRLEYYGSYPEFYEYQGIKNQTLTFMRMPKLPEEL